MDADLGRSWNKRHWSVSLYWAHITVVAYIEGNHKKSQL
jgi:hypothetical protein